MIPNNLLAVVKAAHAGTNQEGEILTFRRIPEIAEREAKMQGSVGYNDYEPELLGECLNGHWKVSQIGWRLQDIRRVLIGMGWKPKGRPVRFYPPE